MLNILVDKPARLAAVTAGILGLGAETGRVASNQADTIENYFSYKNI